MKKFAIIGAGIGGLTVGIMLKKQGFEVEIYEAADSVRGIGAGIGLASNAIKALEYLGLDKEVISISNHLRDFTICDEKGKTILAADTERIKKNYDTDNYAIHRADLHQFLSTKISSEKIHLNKKLKNFIQNKDEIKLEFEDGTKQSVDFLIGADGVNSKVRQLLIPNSEPRFAGYWCWRATVDHNFEGLHKSTEVWGKNGRFGITPLKGNRIYWYACINSDMTDDVKNYKLDNLKKSFKDYFPFLKEVLNLTKEENLISTPIVDLAPIPQYSFGNVLLMGDAAHATTPNMGQGACMALEDVAVLQDELIKNDINTAFINFEKRRLKRTHYITKTSWRAGKVAQSDNSLVIFLRNNLLRIMPDNISQSQLKRLLEEDFMKL
ncbi:FAD-dependent monooxygenase [Moheibacter sediminis]|uniref:2-polyprenyl-6-methoxyphenol hydroxylase n=1 Tax=Moheibacter sediminis TaxID=1434700 RepID=A0A1W2AXV6_9FLAO|nr:FAD-dependent monooxygenase [Moheibacter sediminis]SMC65444.1 2-polyprenyl-6-methoxyphenol hydroxylase [Moheibacter sediminis]